MNSKIINILLALPLLLLAACSADDAESGSVRGDGNGENQKIRFTTSVATPVSGDGGTTRSWADTYNESLPDEAFIYVYLYAYENENAGAIDLAHHQLSLSEGTPWIYQTQAVDPTSGRSPLVQTYPTAAQTSSGDADDAIPVFPYNNENCYVDAIAIFLPAGISDVASSSHSSYSNTSGIFTFTVPTDQITSAAVVSADLLSSDAVTTFKSNASAINLEMKHRMAKVLVVFNPTEDLTAANMPTTNYSVQNVQITRKLTIQSGEVETTGSTSTITAKVGEPFFMPPQTITAETELLKFDLRNIGGAETGIKNVTLKTTADLEFQEGVYYVLTVNVGVRYITLTTTIKAWTDETVNFDKIIL